MKLFFLRFPIILFSLNSIFIPNSFNISDDPDNELAALFPCLLILMPILASNKATVVDIFKVFFPSPPVPHVSKEL